MRELRRKWEIDAALILGRFSSICCDMQVFSRFLRVAGRQAPVLLSLLAGMRSRASIVIFGASLALTMVLAGVSIATPGTAGARAAAGTNAVDGPVAADVAQSSDQVCDAT